MCGTDGTFSYQGGPPRESFECHRCHSTLRYRHQAEVLLTVCDGQSRKSIAELVSDREFAGKSIYEAAIGGSFRPYFADLPNYVNSYYWSDVRPGEVKHGIRSEDLERLTFDDRAFDLVLTSDVFEHVRHPWVAFAEVCRVLKPGGWHVFTVPWFPIHPTRSRLDLSDGELLLMPRRIHGSPTDPAGSLVYTDFGRDLPERLTPLGFDVQVHGTVGRMFTVAAQRRMQ